MKLSLLQPVRLLALASAFLAVSALPALATSAGDCRDPRDQTTIDEVQNCVNIFLGFAEVSSCLECDSDGVPGVAISEVQAGVNCFLGLAACPTVVSGGVTPTESETATPATTETPTITNTPGPTSTFTPTATKTPVPGACGDGLLDAGEECDACTAGELCSCIPADCRICAGDCTVGPCTETTTVQTFRIDYAPPAGQPVSAIKVRVGYRDTKVSITGTGSAAGTSVKNRPSNTTTIVNDLNYALEVTMSRSAGLVAGRLFTVDFKSCTGAAAATLADFSCAVLDCGSSFGSVMGCACTVTTP